MAIANPFFHHGRFILMAVSESLAIKMSWFLILSFRAIPGNLRKSQDARELL